MAKIICMVCYSEMKSIKLEDRDHIKEIYDLCDKCKTVRRI